MCMTAVSFKSIKDSWNESSDNIIVCIAKCFVVFSVLSSKSLSLLLMHCWKLGRGLSAIPMNFAQHICL